MPWSLIGPCSIHFQEVVVEEKHTIECPTLMLWLLMRQACGVKSFAFTHQNPQQWRQTSEYCPRQTKGNIYDGFSPRSWGEKHHWVPNFDVVVVNETGLWGKIFCFHTSEPTATATNLWPLSKTNKRKHIRWTSPGSWGETHHWVPNFDVLGGSG
jgi:hypothetical protein